MEETVENTTTAEVVTESVPSDDSLTLSDFGVLTGLVIVFCAGVAFLLRTIDRHIKNIKLKVGNKLELGLETESAFKGKEKEDAQKN
jgi:hypothetical protein